MVRVSGPTINKVFLVMVRVRDWVILGYDVIINTYTGVLTKVQTAVRRISSTVLDD